MSECLSIVRALKMVDLQDIVIISDGRFSGFTKGYLAIGHVCPEAQVGGPIALLRDGDRIVIDIPNNRLDVELSASEMERRKQEWNLPTPSKITGVLAMYAKVALQADQGAGWPTNLEDFD